MPENIDHPEDEIEKASATTFAEEQRAHAAAAAIEQIVELQKADREKASGRTDPNQKLSFARCAYESVHGQNMQPWGWDHLIPEGDIPRGYKNPIAWIGVVKPFDWDQKVSVTDDDGKPLLDKNGNMILTWKNALRIRHPNAIFYCARRLQMYKDVILAEATPQWMVLWSLNIEGKRWFEAESLMAEDSYWWTIYQNKFGFGESGTLGQQTSQGDPPSNPGSALASAEV